jgi:hypothetical protein
MSAIHLVVRPCDSGRTIATTAVTGGSAEEILPVSAGQNAALVTLLGLIRGGDDLTGLAAYNALSDKTGADAYIALADPTGADAYIGLADPTGADAYIALDDADILAVVDAAVGLDNMSSAQKAGLLAYIAAIIAEENTSSVETAIGALGE